MERAKLFQNGNSQAVRLPKAFRIPGNEVKIFKKAHDRFLILDEKEVYHFGASLKDLGKKWFAFSKMDIDSVKVLDKISEEGLI